MEAFVTAHRIVPPHLSERGGLPRVMTFKAVPFGSTVSHLRLPHPIPAAPRANVPEGLFSFVFIENIAFCGPWPAAVLLSRERQLASIFSILTPPDRGDTTQRYFGWGALVPSVRSDSLFALMVWGLMYNISTSSSA